MAASKRMEASEVYDLLPVDGKNDKFRVTFDVFKARPHFILLPKTNMSPSHSLTPEQGQQLIVTAREMLASWNFSSGTLSIHRGSWISSSFNPTAHFHLCVDVTNYLRIFKEKEKTDVVSWFKNTKSADHWKDRYQSDYPEKAKKYPKSKYHERAVKEISDIIGKVGISENTENLVFHRKHPKIGFPGNGTAEDLKQILDKMQKYAKDKKLPNGDSITGCHLCLNLGSDSGTY